MMSAEEMKQYFQQYKECAEARGMAKLEVKVAAMNPYQKQANTEGNFEKAPKTLSDVRKLNKIQPVEEIVTPIKDEGKHQIPNDNSLRFAAKDVRQKMSFGLWNTEMAREDARSTIDQKSQRRISVVSLQPNHNKTAHII